MSTSENQPSFDARRDHAAAVLTHLLQKITADVPATLVCVYAYSSDLGQLEFVGANPKLAHFPEIENSVQEILALSIPVMTSDHLCLKKEHLQGTDFQCGMAFPLFLADDVVGVLGFFHQDANVYSKSECDRVGAWIPLVESVLENRRLREDQTIAQAIQYVAHAIGENPDPQDLVDILHEYLCGPHICTCVVMFYGPVREDRPNGPFDYLEVRGSWSRVAGSANGLGMKIYLDSYPNAMSQLDEQKVIITEVNEASITQYDPLIRAFLRAQNVHTTIQLALHAGQRRLGILYVATDVNHQFSTREIRGYQMVSEFVAVSTMTHILQQQHDLVQRGRAALLDAVTDGVMMVLPNDLAGHTDDSAHVLTVNLGFTRMFKLNQAKAQGLSMAQIIEHMQIPQDLRHDLFNQWTSIPMRDPLVQRGEFNMIHPDGFPASIEWYSAPVHHDNRVMGRMYIFHDASASRTAANLRANFVSRVSHELRTPLTSIRGFAEFILEELSDELPDLAREYTEIILNSARHLNALFSEVIEITRADTGEMNLHLTHAHLPDLIINVVALLELSSKERGQNVIMELDDDAPLVLVDENRITQVLTNLLNNAIKYTPPDTRIRIRMDLVKTPAQLPPGTPPDVVIPAILVTVSDEGMGLSQEDAEQVFMPFYRTKDARVGFAEGSGLGLTISRSIIELHRGKIWAEPRKRGRRGARFLFTIPTAEG
jgi:signal transduction histidine kinase